MITNFKRADYTFMLNNLRLINLFRDIFADFNFKLYRLALNKITIKYNHLEKWREAFRNYLLGHLAYDIHIHYDSWRVE